jgi:hypothetical protein
MTLKDLSQGFQNYARFSRITQYFSELRKIFQNYARFFRITQDFPKLRASDQTKNFHQNFIKISSLQFWGPTAFCETFTKHENFIKISSKFYHPGFR